MVLQRHIALFLRVKETELTSVCHLNCVLARTIFMFMISILVKLLILNPFYWFFSDGLRSGLRLAQHVKLIILFALKGLINILLLLI